MMDILQFLNMHQIDRQTDIVNNCVYLPTI